MRNQPEDPFVPGMLTNLMDIKILICYLLNSVGEPMDKEQMIDMIFENDIAEYFDIRAAVMQLVENGNVTENSEGFIALTHSGREAAEQLESSLPFTAREKVVREGLKITTLSKRKKANKAEIEKTKDGVFVHCELLDDTQTVFEFKIPMAAVHTESRDLPAHIQSCKMGASEMHGDKMIQFRYGDDLLWLLISAP